MNEGHVPFDLVAAVFEQRDRGEAPDLLALCGGDADLAGKLQKVLDRLDRVAEVAWMRTPLKLSGADSGPGPGTDAGNTRPLPLSAAGGADASRTRAARGYQLVRLLGRGGCGEVWEAVGPGGYAAAIKFVPQTGVAERLEQRALELLREVRHPNLLTVFGFWVTEDWLVIAAEMADMTLYAVAEGARKKGQVGVPAAELLPLMRDVARGLDYLHGRNIVHRDVKPANLMVVGGGAKVADFGLARSFDQSSATATGHLTPCYAAPEMFENRVTPRSDQYSLAMAYCHLRTGRLPFACDSAAAWMKAHLHDEPDLTALPKPERAVVARALHKRPVERWPTCQEFVTVLERGQQRSSTSAIGSPWLLSLLAVPVLAAGYTVGLQHGLTSRRALLEEQAYARHGESWRGTIDRIRVTGLRTTKPIFLRVYLNGYWYITVPATSIGEEGVEWSGSQLGKNRSCSGIVGDAFLIELYSETPWASLHSDEQHHCSFVIAPYPGRTMYKTAVASGSTASTKDAHLELELSAEQ